MFEWLHQLHDPQALTALIATYGVALLVGIVFAETGLLVGFFLPGDSLLFLAGALCSVNLVDKAAAPPLEFWATASALIVAAILGNSLNWQLGKWVGDRAWNWSDGRLFKRRYLADAHAFYEKWGALSLVLTRFIPVARTFVPFIAGISRMRFAAYSLWNAVGAVIWVPSLMAGGYWLGQIEWVQHNLEAIVLGVIVISVTPMAIGAVLRWNASRRAARAGQG